MMDLVGEIGAGLTAVVGALVAWRLRAKKKATERDARFVEALLAEVVATQRTKETTHAGYDPTLRLQACAARARREAGQRKIQLPEDFEQQLQVLLAAAPWH